MYREHQRNIVPKKEYWKDTYQNDNDNFLLKGGIINDFNFCIVFLCIYKYIVSVLICIFSILKCIKFMDFFSAWCVMDTLSEDSWTNSGYLVAVSFVTKFLSIY